MKITHLTDTFTPEINGVANNLNRLNCYLETKGIQHTFVTADYNKSSVKEPGILTGMKRVHPFMNSYTDYCSYYKYHIGIWSRGIDTGIFNAGLRSSELKSRLGAGDKFAFLNVGRLSPEKGLHMMMHAIRGVNRSFTERAEYINEIVTLPSDLLSD